MTRRDLLTALTLATAFLLSVMATAPASAESGAHRLPPAPPIDTPIEITGLD